jgi:hypothetical protein
MTVLKEKYWCSNDSWWHIENMIPVINKDAPKEAQESYKRYLKEVQEAEKRGVL